MWTTFINLKRKFDKNFQLNYIQSIGNCQKYLEEEIKLSFCLRDKKKKVKIVQANIH